MLLRPHHLLCIQKFTGHGYDAGFTAHMTAVSEMLRGQPDSRIVLKQGADALCARCPHLRDGECDAADKTDALDRNVLDALSLQYGDAGTWRAFAGDAYTKILQTHAFHKICSCCQWYDLCRRTEVSSL
ncbi:MAG: DUF1284 domain-containing protein [Oscillospiraceae bacterium]|nr:DUF1284 domain-containing protein [Oscillospiraceae bacterium]